MICKSPKHRFHSCNLYSYAILKDQQKEAGIGPKKRKGQDAHDSSHEDSEMQVSFHVQQ